MNNLKIYFTLILAIGILTINSCKKDDDEAPAGNTITITIQEPIDGETLVDCSDVHIHVEVIASEENHEVEIVLHPEGDTNDKIIDFDKHDHDRLITFEQGVDLCSYGSGACFHLEVEACIDHDCAERETAEVEFCLQ